MAGLNFARDWIITEVLILLIRKLHLSNYIRAPNNGQSTNNVQNDWGVDRSTFHLAGHAGQSHSDRIEDTITKNLHAVQLFQLLSVCSESPCIDSGTFI